VRDAGGSEEPGCKKEALSEVPALKKKGRTRTKLTSQNVLIVVIYSRQRPQAANSRSAGDPGALCKWEH